MSQTQQQNRPAATPEDRDPAVLVDVLVLSTDLVLFEAIRAAIGERNPVWRARSAEESVDLLLTGRCGVLLVDMAAVSGTPATLIERISEQFPDLVIVVAGRREDEALLAQLISNGCVYRFMHKPLTAKRAGMFLQASIRRHVELRESQGGAPLIPVPGLPSRFDPRKWLFVGAGVLLFIAILYFAGGPREAPPREGEEPADPPPAAATAPVVPLADPVLSRARAAYAAGRYESPEGRNALDLYAAVLLARPGQAEATAGLAATVEHVVAEARAAVASGNTDEARRLLARLEDVAPGTDAVVQLADELEPPAAAAAPAVVPAAADDEPATAYVPPATGLAAVPTPSTARGPVTSLAPRPPDAPAKPAATRAPRVAGPDPLAPRIANADELRLRELANRQAVVNLRSGRSAPARAAAVPQHALAGLATPTAGDAAPLAPPPHGAVPDAGPATPDDALGRIRVVDPVYPPEARRDHVEGWVELEFTITESGSVRDVVVVGSQPQGVFDAAAQRAVSEWLYRPRTANGQPVQRRSSATLHFDIDG